MHSVTFMLFTLTVFYNDILDCDILASYLLSIVMKQEAFPVSLKKIQNGFVTFFKALCEWNSHHPSSHLNSDAG